MSEVNAKLARFSDEELNEAFEYLDELRESGETNMFGAAAYVQRELEHSIEDARILLSAWMKTFDPEKLVDARVAESRATP